MRKIIVFCLGMLCAAFSHGDDGYFKKLVEPAYGLWAPGIVSRSPNYRSVDSEIAPALFIFGGYGPIFIEANRFGYNFYRDGTWFASVIGQFRTQHARDEENDSGLKDRRVALEVGAQLGRRLPYGFISRLAWLQDVSGSHKGYELDWQLYRRDRFGSFTLLTTLALQYQPEQLVDYYYGAPGINFSTDYEADSQIVQELEVILRYDYSDDINLFIGTRNYRYQASIEDSPVADGRNIIQGFAGVGYRF